MNAPDFLDLHNMSKGTSKPAMIRKIMAAGECVGPELAYQLTGKPDQNLTINQALRLAGCEPVRVSE